MGRDAVWEKYRVPPRERATRWAHGKQCASGASCRRRYPERPESSTGEWHHFDRLRIPQVSRKVLGAGRQDGDQPVAPVMMV